MKSIRTLWSNLHSSSWRSSFARRVGPKRAWSWVGRHRIWPPQAPVGRGREEGLLTHTVVAPSMDASPSSVQARTSPCQRPGCHQSGSTLAPRHSRRHPRHRISAPVAAAGDDTVAPTSAVVAVSVTVVARGRSGEARGGGGRGGEVVVWREAGIENESGKIENEEAEKTIRTATARNGIEPVGSAPLLT